MSVLKTGSAASFPSMLFLNWRLHLVLSGNSFKLISRRIQLFSQRCKTSLIRLKSRIVDIGYSDIGYSDNFAQKCMPPALSLYQYVLYLESNSTHAITPD